MNTLINKSINEVVRILDRKGFTDTSLVLASIGEKVLNEVVYYTNRIEYNGSNLTIEEVFNNLVFASTEKQLKEILKRASYLLSDLEEEDLIEEVEEALIELKIEYKEVKEKIEEYKHSKSLLMYFINRRLELESKILEIELRY